MEAPPDSEFISLVINSKLLYSENAVPLIEQARLFGNSGACSACGQSIPASELVMRAQGNVYHLKCFTCSTCRNRLVPGDRFHYINGSLFCEHDRPTALINGHLNSLQSNPLLPDQKVC
ncbi:LIM domain transcription factor LMO4.2, partial [Eschrichtius robustus]|nr:LIM domain transcription factor LMO4.2 [Eschrichtius robustus]